MTTVTASAGREPRCVTWPQFLAGVVTLLTIGGASLTFVWAQHASHPHAGTVTHTELRHFEERVIDSITNNRSALRALQDKIDRILERLPK